MNNMEKNINNDYKKSICILVIGIIILLLGYLPNYSDYRLPNKIYIIATVAIVYGLTSLVLHKYFLSLIIKRLARKKNENYILIENKATNIAFWVVLCNNVIFYIFSDILMISLKQFTIYVSLLMITIYFISWLVYYKKD